LRNALMPGIPSGTSSLDPGGEMAAASIPMQLASVELALPASAKAVVGAARVKIPAVSSPAQTVRLTNSTSSWAPCASPVALRWVK